MGAAPAGHPAASTVALLMTQAIRAHTNTRFKKGGGGEDVEAWEEAEEEGNAVMMMKCHLFNFSQGRSRLEARAETAGE